MPRNTHPVPVVRDMKSHAIFRRFLGSLGWILPVLILLILRAVVPWETWLQPALAWLGKSGWWGMALAVLLYVPLGLFLVPASALTILVGVAHGFWAGLACVTMGANGAAWAAFALARLYRVGAQPKDGMDRRMLSVINEQGERWGFWLVTLARLSIFVPYGPLNYLLGFSRVRVTDYALGTFLGMLPGSALYLWAGTALAAESGSNTAAGNILLAIGLISLALLLALVGRMARQAILEAGLRATAPDKPADGPAATRDQAGSGAASSSAITTS